MGFHETIINRLRLAFSAFVLISLLINSYSEAKNRTSRACVARLFHAPADRQGNYYWYSDKSWFLIEKMEEPIPVNVRRSFQARWRRLDNRATRNDWFAAMDRMRDQSTAEYERYNFLRMKPSNSISNDRTGIHETKWETAEAMVRRWAMNGDDLSLTKLKKINRTVGEPAKFPGVLRARTGLDDFTDPKFAAFSAVDVKNGMDALMDWYHRSKSRLHPIELATIFYQRFTTIHPFTDGNGRTARLAMDWILMMNGFPPAVFTVGNVGVQRSWVPERDHPLEHGLTIVTDAVENSMNLLAPRSRRVRTAP